MGIKGKDGEEFLGAQAAGIEGGLDGITPTGNGWVLMDQHTEATVIEVGTPVGQGDDTEPYIVTDYTLSTVSERFEAVEGYDVPDRTTVAGGEPYYAPDPTILNPNPGPNVGSPLANPGM